MGKDVLVLALLLVTNLEAKSIKFTEKAYGSKTSSKADIISDASVKDVTEGSRGSADGSDSSLFQRDTNNTLDIGIALQSPTGVQESQSNYRNSVKYTKYHLWPNKIVYYWFDDSVTALHRHLIRSVLSNLQIKLSGCVKFQEKYTGKAIKVSSKNDFCYYGSPIGYHPDSDHVLNLSPKSEKTASCMTTGIIEHEFLHAVGLDHTQSRFDRDDYIEILWDNVKDIRRMWFNISDDMPYYGLPYDFYSVMHYTKKHFSKNDKLTIKTKDSKMQDVIGQVRQGGSISTGDIQLIQHMYNCPIADVKYLTSPSFPHIYPKNQHIKQKLSVPDGYSIHVRFDEFQIESHHYDRSCYWDYLKFCDGNGKKCWKKLCGRTLPPAFIIPTSTATALFHSDYAVNRKGYKLSYQAASAKTTCATACEWVANGGYYMEAGKLDLSCRGNKKIRIISALYGRLESNICIPYWVNAANFSLQCSAANAFRKVEERCGGKKRCSVEAKNGIFGDPCFGTWKHLKICYSCDAVYT